MPDNPYNPNDPLGAPRDNYGRLTSNIPLDFMGDSDLSQPDNNPFAQAVGETLTNIIGEQKRLKHETFVKAAAARGEEADKARAAGLSPGAATASRYISFEAVEDIRQHAPKFYEEFIANPDFSHMTGDRINDASYLERSWDYVTDFTKSMRVGAINFESSYLGMKHLFNAGQSTEDRQRLEHLDARRAENIHDIERYADGSIRGQNPFDNPLNLLNWPIAVGEQVINLGGAFLMSQVGGTVGGAVGGLVGTLGFLDPSDAATVPAGVVGGTLMGRAAGVVAFTGFLEGGALFNELVADRERRGEEIDYDELRVLALGGGLVNGIFEAVGMAMFARVIPKSMRDKIGLGDTKAAVRQLFGTETGAKAAAGIFKRYAQSIAAETGTEAFQEMVNALAVEFDAGGFDGVGDVLRFMGSNETISRVAHAGFKGFQVAAVLGGGAVGVSSTVSYQETVKGKKQIDTIVRADSKVRASHEGMLWLQRANEFAAKNKEMIESNPEQVGAYVEKIAEQTGITDVHIGAKTLQDMFDTMSQEESTRLAEVDAGVRPENEIGEKGSRNFDKANLYHSTDEESAENITAGGFQVVGDGYYGDAISLTGNKKYSQQFGGTTIEATLKPGAKILDLSDENDWKVYQNIEQSARFQAASPTSDGAREDQETRRDVFKANGVDGLYDDGAGDLFIFNENVLQVGRNEAAEASQSDDLVKHKGNTLAKLEKALGSQLEALPALAAAGDSVALPMKDYIAYIATEDTLRDSVAADIKVDKDHYTQKGIADEIKYNDEMRESYEAAKVEHEQIIADQERVYKDLILPEHIAANEASSSPLSMQEVENMALMDAYIVQSRATAERISIDEALEDRAPITGVQDIRAELDEQMNQTMQREKTAYESTPEFGEFFGDSQVVDESGKPMVVYHSTVADKAFGEFKTDSQMGAHFGTKGQAAARHTMMSTPTASRSRDEFPGRTIPVYLKLENPLRMEDAGNFEDRDDISLALSDHPGIRTDLESFFEYQDDLGPASVHVNDGQIAREFLKGAGFDGIVYKNEGEDTGGIEEDSYIVFDSDQIISAINPQSTDVQFQVQREAILDAQEQRMAANPELASGEFSTRVVTSKTSSLDHNEEPLHISYEDYLKEEGIGSRPSAAANNLKSIDNNKDYPSIDSLEGTTEEKAEQVVEFMKNNLLWLHDKMPETWRQRAKLWYDGGNKMVIRLAERYGIEEMQAAGVIAAMSPQREWFTNMSNAERVMDILTFQGDTKLTPEMTHKMKVIHAKPEEKEAWQQRHDEAEAKEKAVKKDLRAAKKKGTEKKVEQLTKRLKTATEQREKLKAKEAEQLKKTMSKEAALARSDFDNIQGKTMNELRAPTRDDLLRRYALWVRLYDEAHNTRSHRIITPEGHVGAFATKGDGVTQKTTTWGSYNEIGKAISIFLDGSLSNISNSLGDKHKVRSFTANLLHPNSKHGHGTIDTHAVSAAFFTPYSSSDNAPKHNFDGSTNGATGHIGTYPIILEAYRRAAKERGILPREMQSITWEAIRGLFTKKGKKNKVDAEAVWKKQRNGETTVEEAREELFALSGEIDEPAWVRLSIERDEGITDSTYLEELPSERGVGRDRSEHAVRGLAGRDSSGDSDGRIDRRDDTDLAGLKQRIRTELKSIKHLSKREQTAHLTRLGYRRDVIWAIRKRYAAEHNGRPQPYRGRSDGAAGGVRRLTPDPEVKELLEMVHHSAPEYTEYAPSKKNAKKFHKAITFAKDNNTFGAAVEAKALESYGAEGVRLFLTDDNSVGFAMIEGDLVSGFVTDKSPHKGAVPSLFMIGIQEGATRADAFDTVLPQMYAEMGFVATSRIPWNEQYKPEGWDKKLFKLYNNGKPDVVLLAYDPSYYGSYSAGKGKSFKEWDDAAKMQSKRIRAVEKARRESGSQTFFQSGDEDIDPHKTPKQVEILSGVLKAAQNAPQAKGNKDYWLSTKTNKDGSTTFGGILAKGTKTDELNWMEAEQAIHALASEKAFQGLTPQESDPALLGKVSLTREEVVNALESRVIVIERITDEIEQGLIANGVPVVLDVFPSYVVTGELEADEREALEGHWNGSDELFEAQNDASDENLVHDFMDRAREEIEDDNDADGIDNNSADFSNRINTLAHELRDEAINNQIASSLRSFKIRWMNDFDARRYDVAADIDSSGGYVDVVLRRSVPGAGRRRTYYAGRNRGSRVEFSDPRTAIAFARKDVPVPSEFQDNMERSGRDTKHFGNYTEDGGEDYRENKLVWMNPPEGTSFDTPDAHKFTTKNIIAFVRTKIREFRKPHAEMAVVEPQGGNAPSFLIDQMFDYNTDLQIPLSDIAAMIRSSIPGDAMADILARHFESATLWGATITEIGYHKALDIVEDFDMSIAHLMRGARMLAGTTPDENTLKAQDKLNAAVKFFDENDLLDEDILADPQSISELPFGVTEEHADVHDGLNLFLDAMPDELSEQRERLREEFDVPTLYEYSDNLAEMHLFTFRVVATRLSQMVKRGHKAARQRHRVDFMEANKALNVKTYTIEEMQTDWVSIGHLMGFMADKTKGLKKLEDLDKKYRDTLEDIKNEVNMAVENELDSLKKQLKEFEFGTFSRTREVTINNKNYTVETQFFGENASESTNQYTLETLDEIWEGKSDQWLELRQFQLQLVEDGPGGAFVPVRYGGSINATLGKMVRHAMVPGNSAFFIKDLKPELYQRYSEAKAAFIKQQNKDYLIDSVPFRNNWHEMAMRQSIKDALNQGMTNIAWSTGEMHINRWNTLAQDIDKADWKKDIGGKYVFVVYAGGQIKRETFADADLESAIGAANARKVRESDEDSGTLEDFVMNDQFMINLYDKDIVRYMNKLGKKYGAKVEKRTDDSFDSERKDWWFFEIPEAMQEDVWEEGLTLFSEEFNGNGRSKPRGAYDPKAHSIMLSPNANASTYIHEQSHAHMHLLIRRAGQGDTAAQKDLGIILEWLELGTLNDLMIYKTDSDEVKAAKVKKHEQFADGFILYMAEGNAPSAELKNIFDKFRDWLVEITKKLMEDIDFELSDEVREVYGRMVHNEADLSAARDVLLAHPLGQEQLGMKDAQYAKYKQTIHHAIQEARRSLDADVGQKANRVKSAAYKKRKTAITKLVNEEADDEPAFQLRSMTMTPGSQVKFNTAEIEREMKGEPRAAEIMRGVKASYNNAGDASAAFMAEDYGYATTYDMLRAMHEAGPKAKAVKKRVSERMLEEEAADPSIARLEDLTTDEAMAAMHNAAWENTILAEVAALETATGRTRSFPAETMKVNAARLVADVRLNDLKPGLYLRAERQAANAAIRALEQGDQETGLHEKSRQLMNQYLYREATDKRERADKALKRLQRLNTKKGRAGIDATFLPHIGGILARFDLRRNAEIPDEELSTAAEVREFVSGADNADSLVGLGEAIRITEDSAIYEEAPIPWHQLTVEEFEIFSNAMLNLVTIGKAVKTVNLNGEVTNLEETAGRVEENLVENVKERASKIPTAGPKLSLLTYWTELRKRRNIARKIDGFKDSGAAQDILISNMSRVQGKEEDRLAIEFERLRSIFDQYGLNAGAMKKKHKFANGRLEMNTEQVLSVALNYGNAENRQRITESIGYYLRPGEQRQQDEEAANTVVDEIIRTLTDDQWSMVQEVWDYLETYWPEVAALEQRTTGIIPKKVDHVAFTTPTGKPMRGGYYPIAYDSRMSNKSKGDVERLDAMQNMGGSAVSAMTAHGHDKERVGSGGRIVKLELSVMFSHVGQVVHDLTHRETLIGLHRILREPSLAAEMQGRLGQDDYNQWMNWIHRTANGDERATTSVEHWAGKLRGRVTIMGMGLNFSTAALQLMGLTQSQQKIGGKWVGAAMGEYMANAGNLKEWRGAINEKSNIMERRGENFNRDVRELGRQLSKGRKLSLWESALFSPIVAMQSVVDAITWTAAYNKAVYEGETDEKAGLRADEDVALTQGSGRISDLSGIEGGRPFLKLFTTFYSFMNTMFNLTVDEMQKIAISDRPRAMKMVKTAQTVFLIYILPATMTNYVLDILIAGEEPEDEKEWLLWLGQNNMNYFVGQFPFLREAVPTGFRYSGPAGLRFFENLQRGAVAAQDLLPGGDPFGGDDIPDFLDDPLATLDSSDSKAIIDAFGVAVPLPTTELKRLLAGLHRIAEGETEGPVDALTGLFFRKAK